MVKTIEEEVLFDGQFLIPPREDIQAIMIDSVNKKISISSKNIEATKQLVKAFEKANRLPPVERRVFKRFMQSLLPRDF